MCDYVIACSSLKGTTFSDEGGRRFRIKATQGGHLRCRKRKGECRNGEIKEEVTRKEAQKRKVGKEAINGIMKMDVDDSVENEGKRTGWQDFLQR